MWRFATASLLHRVCALLHGSAEFGGVLQALLLRSDAKQLEEDFQGSLNDLKEVSCLHCDVVAHAAAWAAGAAGAVPLIAAAARPRSTARATECRRMARVLQGLHPDGGPPSPCTPIARAS